MEISSTQINNLFEIGEYGKVVSKIGKNRENEEFLNDIELVNKFILSCYYNNNHPIMFKILKKVIKHFHVFDELLLACIKNRDVETIEKIEKMKKPTTLINRIKFKLLEMEIRGKYIPKSNEKFEIGDRIKQCLNDGDFYNHELCSEVLDALRLRTRKMYRSGEFDKIISWISETKINDLNFEIYQYLLLIYRDKKNYEKVLDECMKSLQIITEPFNYEIIIDLLYTIGENEKVVEVGTKNDNGEMTFRSKLILARSIRKLGDSNRATEIIQQSKLEVENKIIRGGVEVVSSVGDINQITYSGDVDFSENLLYKLLKNEESIGHIINNEKSREVLNLCAKILDSQKRQRLNIALDTARILINNTKYKDATTLLTPYINHGITNSANLFDTYLIACHGSGRINLIEEMIIKNTKNLEIATIERLSKTLENKKLFPQYKILLDLVPDAALNSYKFIRSYFNILQFYDELSNPKEILIRMSKNKNINTNTLIYFIERNLRNGNIFELDKILLTLRMDKLTKLYCRLRFAEKKSSDEVYLILKEVKLFDSKMINPEQEELFRKLINESINIAFYNDYDNEVIEIIKIFDLINEYDSRIFNSYIRSLIRIKDYKEIKIMLHRFVNEISDINRLRILTEIGENKLVEMEFKKLKNKNYDDPKDNKIIDDLYFKNGHFKEYLIRREKMIMNGYFNLNELTRYFYSLLKLGQNNECRNKYNKLRRRFNHQPEKKAIIAILGYDFDLNSEYFDELELASKMAPRSIEIIITIINSFIKMERIDIAYYFLKRGLLINQNNESIIKIGMNISQVMKDLKIDINKITKISILKSPIYTDVEVMRNVIDILPERKVKIKKSKKKVAIHSHTLDIGGAERQVSYLLNLLHKKEVKNSDFALVTNKIPNESNIVNTYYKDLKIDEIDIFEYYIPVTNSKVNKNIRRKIRHLNPLKFSRLESMIEIYSNEGFSIAHTWQDYCNIYGGLAALIVGVDKIMMSARTVSPPRKSILAIRQSRSYKECYQLLLNNENVFLTHNSEYGSNDYKKWLEIDNNKNIVIHNGIDVKKKNGIITMDIKENLNIGNDNLVVGYVGRFTADKRPWLFLRIAERILSKDEDDYSKELEEWYNQNEDSFSNEEYTNDIVLKPSLHFIMVGDGPQFDLAKQIVEKSNILKQHVHLVGFSDNVDEYLRIFDCFLLTSKVEGLPNVIIEAQMLSVPVVSTNAGGSAECFIEGKTGFISKDSNIFELEKLIVKVLEDEDFRINVKKIAPKFITERFGRKKYSENINKIYAR